MRETIQLRRDTRSSFSSAALRRAVKQRDSHTLAVLLRYGTDPEGQATPRDARQPLAVAASSDVTCLLALVLAGASTHGNVSQDASEAFCQSGTQTLSISVFCSPMSTAFAAIRPYEKGSIGPRQFGIAHFLMVNGADSDTRMCTNTIEFDCEAMACQDPAEDH